MINIDCQYPFTIRMVRIGYMGIPGSNSEEAAMRFMEGNGLDGAELVPLMDSHGVVDAMEKGECEYGVVASRNIKAGPVDETIHSLEGKDWVGILDEIWIPIHHCVFVKDSPFTINRIVSHVQAILQCNGNLEKLFPGAIRIECEDTALAARLLAEGGIPQDSAVLCRRNAGEMFGLLMIHENIEDDSTNMTQFQLLHRR